MTPSGERSDSGRGWHAAHHTSEGKPATLRPMIRKVIWLVALATAGCASTGSVFPNDVQQAFQQEPMLRAETEHLVLYYPAKRQAMVERFAVRADACAGALKRRARHHGRTWAEKMTITMPEVTFNNAYVSPKIAGEPDVSVVPTLTNLDFTTEMGLPPDAGFVTCHELVHYVQFQQISGLWSALDLVFGDLYTPQLGFEPWFFEGLATYYESALQPGVGRPLWPTFNAMFAAAYAGRSIGAGELSVFARRAPVGHQYLVGTMFVRFLAERYGEDALWKTIASQAGAWTGLFSPLAFRKGFGKSLPSLWQEFNAWHRERFPARSRPAEQRSLRSIGSAARYARGRDGSEAWVAEDVDERTTLMVRGPDGAVRAELALTELIPPRTLTISAAQFVSGLSLTDDGREVWFTAIDLGGNRQVPRLLRWREHEGIEEVASGLGAGGTIDSTGRSYYYLEADGDRWNLAVYDVATGARRRLLEAAPGTYVLSAQLSPEGRTLVASAWNGAAFVLWLLDAQTGAFQREIAGEGALYDASFLEDGRLLHLAAIDGRFQVQTRAADGSAARTVTDVPYSALAPRAAGGTVRFLNREVWRWTLDEVALPPAPAEEPPVAPREVAVAAPGEVTVVVTTPEEVAPETTAAPSPAATPAIAATTTAAAPASPIATAAAPASPIATAAAPASPLHPPEPYSRWERFFEPSLRMPFATSGAAGDGGHLGLVLGGSDTLGSHGWLLAGAWQPHLEGDTSDRTYLGGLVAYRNAMLAPWTFGVFGSRFRGVEQVENGDIADEFRLHDNIELGVTAGRIWKGTWGLTGSFAYTDRHAEEIVALAERRVRLAGPGLSLQYFGGDGTAYTGLSHAFAASLSAAYYPGAWSSLPRDATVLAGSLLLARPLPFTKRHVLTLELTGMAVVRPEDLIELGGASTFAPLSFRSDKDEPAEPSFGLPSDLRQLVPLRGYEDTTFGVSSVIAGELSWTYPIIIDRGTATTLWLLPSSFLRQLDLDLFAAGALAVSEQSMADQPEQHLAAGGSLTLRLALWQVPISLRLQLARRLRDDRAFTQLLGISTAL